MKFELKIREKGQFSRASGGGGCLHLTMRVDTPGKSLDEERGMIVSRLKEEVGNTKRAN